MNPSIKTLILDLAKNGEFDWKGHLESVVRYSLELADRLHADKEIVELAAWLHDIAKMKGIKEMHHVHGARMAEEILQEQGYPEKTISAVTHCIECHSTDKSYEPKTTEAKIVASADALDHFDRFMEYAYKAYGMKGLGYDEGKEWLVQKFKRQWEKMMPEAQEMGKEKYQSLLRILGAN